jgi:photosystem II stability/assembly factor-like uncharacterized protein
MPRCLKQLSTSRFRLLVISLCLLAYSAAFVLAQSSSVSTYTWSRSGPNVGTVNALVIAPSNTAVRYAGIVSNSAGYGPTSNSGIYKSTDSGLNWSKVGLDGKTVYSLALDPTNASTVYAGTGVGLYKTTDGGGSWNGPYLSSSAFVIALTIDPGTPSVVYGSAAGNGLYKSTDAGMTWTSISSGIQFYTLHGIAIDPRNSNTVYAAGGYNTTTAVYKSTNGGANWSVCSTGIPDSTDDAAAIALSQSDASILYVGKGNTVYKSTDSGASWSPTGTGLPNSLLTSLAVDPTTPSIVLAGTISQGVFRSIDGGGTWNSTQLGEIGVNTVSFEAGNSNNAYAGTRGSGIVKSTDAGTNWSPAIQLPYGDVRELTANPANGAVLYAYTSDGIYKSSDGGGNWFNSLSTGLALVNGIPTNKLRIDPTNPAVLYAGIPFLGVLKSTDGGATWTFSFRSGNTNVETLSVDPGNPQNIYLVTDGARLYKSTDGGATWPQINNPGLVFVIVVDPTNSSTVYAGTAFGVATSTNGGANWQLTALNNTVVTSLVMDPNNAAILYAATDSGGVYKSIDGGVSWNAVFTDVGGHVLSFAFDPSTAGTVFVGTDHGVFMSINGGQSSGNFSNGIPASAQPIMALSYDAQGRTLYAGTQQGVFKLVLGPAVNQPISGRVTDIKGIGISGVELNVTGSPSGQTISALTDANGNYSFNNSVGGDTLTASKDGFVFNPSNYRTVSSGGPIPITGTFNFTGGISFVTLSGKSTDGTGTGLGDVFLMLTGSTQGGGITDPNGNYAFPGIFPGGNYTVTPSKQGYVFFPNALGFNNLPPFNLVLSTFVGTTHPINIGGQVKDGASNPLSGASVRLRRGGAESFSMQTNDSGNFSFANLAPEMTYSITPVKAGFSFSPSSATFSNSSGNQIANFTATPLPTVQFGASNFSVGNGDIKATITVTRTGDLTIASTVDYSTSDGTASQRVHYTAASGTLAFAAGEKSKQIIVLVTDSAQTTYPATVNLTLSNASGATLGTPVTAILTITQNHTWPQGTNPADDVQFFVRQHYYDFLSRVPDQGGFDFWTGQITQCGSDQMCLRQKRIDVSDAFFYELEYQQTGSYVYRLYRAAFGNKQPFPNTIPDPVNPGEEKKLMSYQAFASDRARVVGGTTLAQSQLDLANLFVQRSEFLARYPANLGGPGFVDAVLATIKNDLGADLTSQRQALIDLFNASGRGAVMYRLVDDNVQTNPINNRALIDAEYNRAFVATQYFGYLRRDPDMAGFLFWLGQVNRAPLRDVPKQHAMVCSFITSIEYQQRFSSVALHSNEECPR